MNNLFRTALDRHNPIIGTEIFQSAYSKEMAKLAPAENAACLPGQTAFSNRRRWQLNVEARLERQESVFHLLTKEPQTTAQIAAQTDLSSNTVQGYLGHLLNQGRAQKNHTGGRQPALWWRA